MGSPDHSSSELCHYEGKSLGLALKNRAPERYAAIVEALRDGASLREAAIEFGISKNTAGAIALRELGADHVRRASVANLTQLVHACSESLLNELDSVAPAQKAVIMGIAQDKLLALGATREPQLASPASLTQVNIAANISDEAVEKLIAAVTKRTETPTITIEA
jgi:hypothetical protein